MIYASISAFHREGYRPRLFTLRKVIIQAYIPFENARHLRRRSLAREARPLSFRYRQSKMLAGQAVPLSRDYRWAAIARWRLARRFHTGDAILIYLG